MTLMDAPKFDEKKAKLISLWIRGILGGTLALVIGFWLVCGHPFDMPWHWWAYWAGERDANLFLRAVEQNDMVKAYGIWVNDDDWREHPDKYGKYTFERFKEDWGPDNNSNDYGTIKSHRVVARRFSGNQMIVGFLMNGRKSKPLFLAYDSKEHTLGFSPFELTLDPSTFE